MNKEEAKQKLHNLAFAKLDTKPDDLKLADVMQIVNQIDEPQKPVIPQFIDEKIKYCKATDGYGLFHAMDYCYNFKECADWLESNEETFALAWIFGYTVEEEKRYVVKMKGIEGHNSYLKYNKNQKHWYFGSLFIYVNDVDTRTYHTRKELEEAGFGWVFDCPGIGIKEVE